MKQQPPERTKRLAVIAAAAVMLVMVLLIIETFRLLLPGLWTAFSSGDEQALSDYLTSEGRLRSFLTLWFLAFVQVVSLVIPAMPVQLAAGIAYGPWKGFVTSFSASVAANFLVFLLARRLAKVIELLTANSPKANKLLNSVRNSKNPWFYTILAFITPGLPNGIIPYAAAHANMKPKQFFAAICISMPIPTLLTCFYSGGAAVQPALNTDLFGLAHAGVNYGLIALGMSAGSLLSYAGSQLLDLPARHMLAVASAVAGGICFLFVKPVATVEKQQGNG